MGQNEKTNASTREPHAQTAAKTDPKQQQVADRLAELKTHVIAPWTELVDKVLVSPTPELLKQIRGSAYKNLFEKKDGYDAFAAYLSADPAMAPFLAAAKEAEQSVAADRPLVNDIEQGLAQLATYRSGGSKDREMLSQIHGQCMSAYARLSSAGRYYVKDRDSVNAVAEPEIKTLLQGKSALVPLDPVAKPGDKPAAAEDAAIKADFEGMKKEILAVKPGDDQAAWAVMQKFNGKDGRVLDLLRADKDCLLKISEIQRAGGGGNGQMFGTWMDSAQQLYWSLRELDAAQQYEKTKAYLLARPGMAPAAIATRRHLLENDLMSGVIRGFDDTKKQEIMRLIARGTAELAPVDTLNNAAATAEDTLKAAIQIIREPNYADLQADQMFRAAIERVNCKQRATVEGLTSSAYEVCLRGWGVIPQAPAKDPENKNPTTEVNPTNDPPPSPVEMQQIEAVFPPTVKALGDEFDSTFYVSDKVIVKILTDFENKVAEPTLRDLFRRAHMNPGAELAKRANQDSRIGNIRQKLHAGLDDDARQVAERVLQIRVDAATVGKVGGQVALADDAKGQLAGNKMPLQQALREVKLKGEATISQVTRVHAEQLADKLNARHLWGGCAMADIVNIYNDYAGKFGCPSETPGKRVIDDLVSLTGMPEAAIAPIEFLANAFLELPNANGDLASRIIERVHDGDQQNCLRAIKLHADDVAGRAAAAKQRAGQAAEAAAGAKGFVDETKDLWDKVIAAQNTNGNYPREAECRAVGTAFTKYKNMQAPPQPGAPQAAAPAPGAVAPGSFADAYKKAYGIEPQRHVVEVARAIAVGLGSLGTSTWLPKMAEFFQISVAEINVAVTATTKVPDEPKALASGFTVVQAKQIAKTIFDAIHKGDVTGVRSNIEGRRTDEANLIKQCFKELSGDVELEFYVRQALEGSKVGGNNFKAAGGEGVRAETTTVDGGKMLSTTSDTNSWEETLDVTKNGRVGILMRVKTALDNGDKNEIFGIVDDAKPEERREILGDDKTMGLIRAKLDKGVDFDRVYAVLTGTADMATRLYSRSEGDTSSSFWRHFTSTDQAGMERDIKEYAARRKEFHTREAEAAGDTPEHDPQFKDKIAAAVKKDLLAAYDNPDARKVIESEFSAWWRDGLSGDGKKVEGMMLASGEDANTSALAANDFEWSSDIVAQVKALAPDQRQRYRNDPNFLMKVNEKVGDNVKRKIILLALQSDEPVGGDHIVKLVELHYKAIKFTDSEARAQISLLTPGEIARLKANPEVVDMIVEVLSVKDEQARFRKILGMDAAGAMADLKNEGGTAHLNVSAVQNPATVGPDGKPKPADDTYKLAADSKSVVSKDELQRLSLLKLESQQRLHIAAARSWSALLGEAVAVFNADFKPKFEQPAVSAEPPAAGDGKANASAGANAKSVQDAEAKAHETTLRSMVWEDVAADVLKAADNNADKTKKDSESIHKAVMHLDGGDPSVLRLKDCFSGWASTFNDDDEIQKTITEASEDVVIKEWSSVLMAKFGAEDAGGEGASFKSVYDAYAKAKVAATANANDKGAQQDLTIKTQAFQRYVIEPSTRFEHTVLPSAGSWLKDKDFGTGPDAELHRKNPQYAKYRGFVNERIKGLKPTAVAAAMGVQDPNDQAIVGSRLRGALTDFRQAQENYAKNRGIDGQSWVGSDEGRRMDRAFGDYRAEVNTAQDGAQNGEISDAKKRELDKFDEDFKARSTEYAAAKDEAAKIAGMVVSTVLALAVGALTAGAGTVAMAAFYGAITAAVAATGQVITEQSIKGEANYDMGGEGAKTVITAAITGAISQGSMFYAGKLTNAILPTMTAQAQGQALGTIAKQTPSIWQTMFRAGAQTGIQTSLQGMSDIIGSGLNPAIWVHGWDEGWYRALDRVAEEVGKQPMNVLKATVGAALGAGAGKILHKEDGGGGGGGDEVKPGERLGLKRVLAQAASDLPGNVAGAVAGTAVDVATGDVKGPKQATIGTGMTVLQGIHDTTMGMQDGSIHAAESERFTLGQLEAHPEQFKNAREREEYASAVEKSFKAGGKTTAHEWGVMCDVIARTLIGENPKFRQLSGGDQRKFIDYVREAPTKEEMQIRAGRDPSEAIGVGTPATTYPAGSEMAKAKDLATKSNLIVAQLGEIHDELMAQENPQGAAVTQAEKKATEGEAHAKMVVDACLDAVAKIKAAKEAAAAGSPEQVELAKQQAEAESALSRAQTLKTLIGMSKAALLRNAHAFDASGVKPGEVPANATGDTKKAFEEAKVLYDRLKQDPYQAGMAELRWQKFLTDHGVEGLKGSTDLGQKEGAVETDFGKKKEAVAKSDHTVAGDGVSQRADNGGKLSIETSKKAFVEVVKSAAGFEGAKLEGDHTVEVTVKLADGGSKVVKIKIGEPHACEGGQIAAMKSEGADIIVWCSDSITDDQVTRALGGVLQQALAVAASKGDPKLAAVYGQIDGILNHLDTIKNNVEPGKITGPAADSIKSKSEAAAENAKYESPARLKAELDLLLFQLGVDQDGPQRALLLKELPASTAAKLQAHFDAKKGIGFNADAVGKSEIPKPVAADDKMPASSVLPGTPAETHPYSAADRKTVVELQLVFEQLKEIDARISQRDQKDTAGAEIAKGETLRRRDLVAKAQKLMGDLQLGGTDKAYYEARLKELEAVFPGISETIKPNVEQRVNDRVTMEEFRKKAAEFRESAKRRSDDLKKLVLGESPFFTNRIVVGDGAAALTDIATLKTGGKGDAPWIDPKSILVLGGKDLLARMAEADPTMRWGQRAEVFDGSAKGETHAMFKGGEGDLHKAQEDDGDFVSVGAMNDAMDMARQRLGIARLEAKVIKVELRVDAKDTWHKDAGSYEVRVKIQIGETVHELYTHATDITTGLGAPASPDESIIPEKERNEMFKNGSMIVGDSVMTDKEVKATMKDKRVLVYGYGPTAAWAAYEAAKGGAAHVDWTGSAGSEAAQLGTLKNLASVDRVAEALNPASKVHTSADRVVSIEPSGEGGMVTFANADGTKTYKVYYDKICLSMGYDTTGARPTHDNTAAPKTMVGNMGMQAAKNGAPVIESQKENGAVRVLGGAGFGEVNMSKEETAKLQESRKQQSLSADSPMMSYGKDAEGKPIMGPDPRVMEFQSGAIEEANK